MGVILSIRVSIKSQSQILVSMEKVLVSVLLRFWGSLMLVSNPITKHFVTLNKEEQEKFLLFTYPSLLYLSVREKQETEESQKSLSLNKDVESQSQGF